MYLLGLHQYYYDEASSWEGLLTDTSYEVSPYEFIRIKLSFSASYNVISYKYMSLSYENDEY